MLTFFCSQDAKELKAEFWTRNHLSGVSVHVNNLKAKNAVENLGEAKELKAEWPEGTHTFFLRITTKYRETW